MVPVGGMFTITTMTTGQKGNFEKIPPSSPSFPLDYADDFQSTEESQNARWLWRVWMAMDAIHVLSDFRFCKLVYPVDSLDLEKGSDSLVLGSICRTPGGLQIKLVRLRSIPPLMARRA